jgi:hypothetical protein
VKVFFDTNVYVAEALLGETATELLAATEGPVGASKPTPIYWTS